MHQPRSQDREVTMAIVRSLAVWLALASAQTVLATEELTPERFKELTTSGKNGMIKFYQPWCGHCTKMKPDWDQLATQAHPSVFIADINCSEQEDLCTENGVQGYPTIKIYRGSADNVDDYKGGRSLSDLLEFVEAELAVKCDINDPVESGCSDKAKEYITKWNAKKDMAAVKKELERLSGMSGQSMKADLKQWLNERIAILRQMTENCTVDKQDACSEKAIEYIGKWKDKDAASIKKELDRLVGMTGDVMTNDLKEWLRERIKLLKQLGGGSDEL